MIYFLFGLYIFIIYNLFLYIYHQYLFRLWTNISTKSVHTVTLHIQRKGIEQLIYSKSFARTPTSKRLCIYQVIRFTSSTSTTGIIVVIRLTTYHPSNLFLCAHQSAAISCCFHVA